MYERIIYPCHILLLDGSSLEESLHFSQLYTPHSTKHEIGVEREAELN